MCVQASAVDCTRPFEGDIFSISLCPFFSGKSGANSGVVGTLCDLSYIPAETFALIATVVCLFIYIGLHPLLIFRSGNMP